MRVTCVKFFLKGEIETSLPAKKSPRLSLQSRTVSKWKDRGRWGRESGSDVWCTSDTKLLDSAHRAPCSQHMVLHSPVFKIPGKWRRHLQVSASTGALKGFQKNPLKTLFVLLYGEGARHSQKPAEIFKKWAFEKNTSQYLFVSLSNSRIPLTSSDIICIGQISSQIIGSP